jgi:hypothetical protein
MNQKDTADFLARLAELEAREERREQERLATQQKKEPNPNRQTKSLGTKTGHRYCTDSSCEYYLVKVPVELEGTETEVLLKDPAGNITDKVENSWITWDYANPDDAVCGCNATVGILPPDSPPPAAGFDDLTALQRRRIKIGDEDALSIKADIKGMRDRQAQVLAKVEAANLEAQRAVEES